jgi:hypothetical protein
MSVISLDGATTELTRKPTSAELRKAWQVSRAKLNELEAAMLGRHINEVFRLGMEAARETGNKYEEELLQSLAGLKVSDGNTAEKIRDYQDIRQQIENSSLRAVEGGILAAETAYVREECREAAALYGDEMITRLKDSLPGIVRELRPHLAFNPDTVKPGEWVDRPDTDHELLSHRLFTFKVGEKDFSLGFELRSTSGGGSLRSWLFDGAMKINDGQYNDYNRFSLRDPKDPAPNGFVVTVMLPSGSSGFPRREPSKTIEYRQREIEEWRKTRLGYLKLAHDLREDAPNLFGPATADLWCQLNSQLRNYEILNRKSGLERAASAVRRVATRARNMVWRRGATAG